MNDILTLSDLLWVGIVEDSSELVKVSVSYGTSCTIFVD